MYHFSEIIQVVYGLTVSPHGQGLGENRRQRRGMDPHRPHQARHEAPCKGMISQT